MHFVERKYRVIEDSPTDRKFNFFFQNKVEKSPCISVRASLSSFLSCSLLIFTCIDSPDLAALHSDGAAPLQAHSLASIKCCTWFLKDGFLSEALPLRPHCAVCDFFSQVMRRVMKLGLEVCVDPGLHHLAPVVL